MQSIRIVRTIEWLDKQITPIMREIILSPKLLTNNGRDTGELVTQILRATHDWAKCIPVWAANAEAVEVLLAFGLRRLLEESEPVKLASAAVSGQLDSMHSYYNEIVLPYGRMTFLVNALEQLVVPEELRDPDISVDILSLTLRSDDRVALTTLRDALTHIEALYELLSELDGKTAEKLTLVRIESGSPVTVNVKGSGEIIKEFRLLIGDIWNRIRFKKQDEQIANNNVLISSLNVMKKIDKRAQDGSLPPEAAEKIKRNLTKNMLGLINCHTLPTDIPEVEEVPNNLLLNGFNPKLLSAATDSFTTTAGINAVEIKAIPARKATKRPAKKRRQSPD